MVIWGYFNTFMKLSHLQRYSSLTKIILIKTKMSDCLHRVVGMIVELLERM